MAFSGDDHVRLLEDALAAVKLQTSHMKRNLETPGKLMDALKCSSTLVSELRTSSLGPKQYYELYMAIFDSLRYLAFYLKENHPVNHLADLYELVQYAGNIVPRLYLMITVGTVYMSIDDAPVKEIMKDMMEMSRGIQHPTRGLFLRYYLAGQARDNLPIGVGDGPEGNLQDSINFILTNFVEMNKLWVRLQHQGHSREREQRVKERQELQLLVGSNLVRLSQLIDMDHYKKVLPALLEQIVQCRDVLAQEYLLEVITQVFPDEYHLHTLDIILSSMPRLNPQVNIKNIVIGLMDRLSAYAAREKEYHSAEQRNSRSEVAERLRSKLQITDDEKKSLEAKQEDVGDQSESMLGSSQSSTLNNYPTENSQEKEEVEGHFDSAMKLTNGIPENVKLFEIFHEQVISLVKVQRLAIADTIALLLSLMNLAINIYPKEFEYVDHVLAYSNEKVSQNANSADLHLQVTQSNILKLILAPIRAYNSLFEALALPSLIPLLQAQPYPTRRSGANEIIRIIFRKQIIISTVEDLELLLTVLKVMVKEGMHQPQSYPGGPIQRRGVETDETIEEQGWLARLVHVVQNDDDDHQLQLLQALRAAYVDGNERIKYTYPPLINAALRLARRIKERNQTEGEGPEQCKTLYRFMHTSLSQLYTRVSGAADLSLRLFVACGQVADQTGFEDLSYEFFAQAFTIYEEAISDSRAQFQAVCIIASALHSTGNFGKENYDTLITKCALYGSKLLKKPDQCRAVYLASHLWWTSGSESKVSDASIFYRDGKRVLECLQRALRVADACMDTSVSIELFVEILNRYVYYFEQENEAVTTKYINGLIELIYSNLQAAETAAPLENSRRHFQRTIDYISSRKYEGIVTKAP